MHQIGEGFMYKVYDSEDGYVIKIPKDPTISSAEVENESIRIHRKYMWDAIPETTARETDTWFDIRQEKLEWELIELVPWTVKSDVLKLLQDGNDMQKATWQLFDVFWLEGLIQVFGHLTKETAIWFCNDLSLPVTKKYLQHKYKMSSEVLDQMLVPNNKPLLSHNMMRTKNGDLKFFDTDYRALSWKKPLHMVWNFYTQKALRLIETASQD